MTQTVDTNPKIRWRNDPRILKIKSEIEILNATASRNTNANIPTQNKGTNEQEKSSNTGCEKSLVN